MLAVRDLRFAHASKAIIDGASHVFDDADRTALVGDNGAGKSTLLRLLAGEHVADSGVIERGRGQRLALLSQEPHLDGDKTAREVVAETGAEPWQVDEALSRLRIAEPDKPTRELSGGQRRRVDLARVLLLAPDILLLDEPTNHLDTSAIAYVRDRLRAWRGPVIIVSHDRAFLDETCTRVVELSRGVLSSYAPPQDGATSLTTSFVEQKLNRDEVTAKTLHKKERLWLRELAWLRAGTPARTTKQTARIDRAAELSAFVESEAEEIRRQRRSVILEDRGSQRLGKTIIDCKGLALERGGRRLFEGLDLIVTRGQRWGVVGDNGAGKTSFLLAIQTACGRALPEHERVLPAAGTIVIGDHTKVAVFDQHRAQLDPRATLAETLAADNDHVFKGNARMHVSSWLERFLFDGSDKDRRTGTLSGGEQNRLVLAKLFLGDEGVLLLDEPTNDLDVTTLGVLEEALCAHDGCAFIVSHDRRFLDRTATGILAFERPEGDGGGLSVVTPVLGDWTHYLRTQSERLKERTGARAPATPSAGASPPAPSTAPSTAPADAARKKRSNKEEHEFQAMEGVILEREGRREALQALVVSPEVMRDGAKAKAAHDELVALEAEIESLYARWQVLSDLSPR